ncbi:MAG: hypothetical protein ACK4UZ_01405, partial [Rhizobium rhizophilum]
MNDNSAKLIGRAKPRHKSSVAGGLVARYYERQQRLQARFFSHQAASAVDDFPDGLQDRMVGA